MNHYTQERDDRNYLQFAKLVVYAVMGGLFILALLAGTPGGLR